MDLFVKPAASRTVQDEMRRSYLDYAMSVIIGRALPDVRDGLKPVQRRILYAMYELGNEYGKPYKKSARIVGDVIDALLALIENPDLTAEELMEFVPAPDFPTGGILYGLEGIREAYRTGKGNVQIRARAFIEKTKKGDRESVVVTEIPYQVNKARLLERIAELARDRKIEEIADLRDESDRDGTRVVIELKKDAVAEVVLNNLYKLTQMQVSFGVQLLAIVQNQPRTLTLKQTLEEFLAYRREVVTKRSLYLLRKAEGRAHILEGLKIALSNLDAVIKLIRASKDPKEAKEGLVKKFALSEIQAQAILDMRLQRLTGLEREKILEELKEVQKEIARLTKILAEETELLRVIAEEFREIREAYADERRSQIVPEVRELGIEDLIVDEEMVVTVSHSGYIKRNPISLYR